MGIGMSVVRVRCENISEWLEWELSCSFRMRMTP